MPRSANLRALRALILVRLREFYREPEAVFWTYVFPILLAGGLGIAFRSQPPEPVRVGWAEWSVGAAGLRAALASDSGIILIPFRDSAAAAMALRNGRVAVLAMAAGDTIGYRYDDTRAETAPALLKLNDVLQRAAGRTDPVATRREFVRERGSRYIDFLLPGLIGLNLMGSGVWGTGFSIVDARRKKLLKRLLATPMSKAEYLFSRVGPPRRRTTHHGRGRLRADEPPPHADVGTVGGVLLGDAVSRRAPTRHPGPPPDRAGRCAPAHHAGGRLAAGGVGPTGGAGGVAGGWIRGGASDLSMVVGPAPSE
jgi:hypothetical protein